MATDRSRSINLIEALDFLKFPASPEIAEALLGYHNLDPTMTIGALFEIASQARTQIEAEHQEMLAETGSTRTKLLIATAVLSKFGLVGDSELNLEAEDLARPLMVKFDSSQLPRELCDLLPTSNFVEYLKDFESRPNSGTEVG